MLARVMRGRGVLLVRSCRLRDPLSPWRFSRTHSSADLSKVGASRWLLRGPHRITATTTTAAASAATRASLSNDVLVAPQKVVSRDGSLPGQQIQISERAAWRLKQIYDESGEVLSISVESGGCHGYQYVLKLVLDDAALPADQPGDDEFAASKNTVTYVMPDHGGKILIDGESLRILDGTTLAYTTELIGSSFKITGGNLKSKCGCGTSFDIN
ncbi:Isa2p KNAG_0H00660 [Huiozyma naganishii CBS 8797]|uniref:Core domain-containing protein n=1 Tax=Huiozyma naganishii (strain ATCC MYA-139 / BCRC 22969 / CBS 8797 / KCTC 17520 / NBRC 10181 / NCYC 3082 / Yp74L-3) TaxID=1071383 RepID=J7S1K4_HUIN7|nr:hypothetical protein KNAG_0H00660 [Kazachstania naganishii CBS 8797]CCK71482.1 hypothetical protein KNAG_0H00660 [Kazachstania naganishii CBS 8797]